MEIAKHLARASLIITTDRDKSNPSDKSKQTSNTIETILNH